MPFHLAGPLTITGNGSLLALVQDSPGEVGQSVGLLLTTRTGERRSVPEYGMRDPLFGGLEAPVVLAALDEWETRADPAEVVIEGRAVQYADVGIQEARP